jgi:hypothetical protein
MTNQETRAALGGLGEQRLRPVRVHSAEGIGMRECRDRVNRHTGASRAPLPRADPSSKRRTRCASLQPVRGIATETAPHPGDRSDHARRMRLVRSQGADTLSETVCPST